MIVYKSDICGAPKPPPTRMRSSAPTAHAVADPAEWQTAATGDVQSGDTSRRRRLAT